MYNQTEIRKIINYFNHKYHGNWDMIYNAIKTQEFIDFKNIDEKKFICSDYICIIDENYPNNFKAIYMPPLSIFFKGNGSLLNSENIISVWGNYTIESLQELIGNNEYVLAFIYDKDKLDVYQYLIENKQKIILLDNDNPSTKRADIISNDDSYCYFSEHQLDSQDIWKSEEQSNQRLLLGVSNASVIIDPNDKELKLFNQIHDFENRQKYYYKVTDKTIKINQPDVQVIEGFDEITYR